MLNILIVDDHTIVRTGLKILIKEIENNCSFEEASNGLEATEKFLLKKYDLVVLDLNLPSTNTSQLISNFVQNDPNVKILIFTMNNENIYAQELFKLGIMGYVSKENTDETIKTAILNVLDNKKYLSDNLIDQLLFTNNMVPSENQNPFSLLSIKELEVARLVCEGHGSKAISNMLDIKINTVSTFKNRIFEKLNISNAFELIELNRIHNPN